ncbi:AhpD family alkylhydroperoxidase [Scopulibacillus darangshiensis]|uniref:AhpD family alkylhydroperoxidase n=1 Tax=Scopulibacillus darangshiensis TaxID=442528 RepID=A0A4R2NRV1_9BACL|nr:carboxymuconolactone decarboxylase family protein [Scopulibacillus darangshiensis]TCP24472.1 AhpD family alkylhydroperoxidase [Scopulibacillus darangshiensis]
MEAGIKIISINNANEELKKVYEEGNGDLANILKVSSLNPKALKKHYEFYKTIMFDNSPLSRRIREMIAVVVSVKNDCFY